MSPARLHPEDLRAIMAAIIYGQGIELIGGVQYQNVNDHAQVVYDVDLLISALNK